MFLKLDSDREVLSKLLGRQIQSIYYSQGYISLFQSNELELVLNKEIILGLKSEYPIFESIRLDFNKFILNTDLLIHKFTAFNSNTLANGRSTQWANFINFEFGTISKIEYTYFNFESIYLFYLLFEFHDKLMVIKTHETDDSKINIDVTRDQNILDFKKSISDQYDCLITWEVI